jgi:lipopolysaccharide export system protein LptA
MTSRPGSQPAGLLNLLRGAGLLVLLASSPALAQRAGPILPGGNAKAPVSIDATKLEYFDKEQKLVYSGNVLAKQGDSSLRATTLVIFLNGAPGQAPDAGAAGNNNNQIKRMEATGPVTIVSKDQVGTGDHGVFDRLENKVYLIGNVTLSQGGNVMKGLKDSRLIYDLTTSHAEIAGGVSSLFTPGSGSDDPLQKRTPDPRPADTRPPPGRPMKLQ